MSTPRPNNSEVSTRRKSAAVTYGEPLPGGKGFRAGPLLIVAGAGTGKTNTLAHRVAHLAMSGVDPARILMLTFTRRAAVEMKRRANEIMREAFNDKLGGKASAVSQRLTWAGTFHSIGNRLLRHYAKHVGLDPAFTRPGSFRRRRPGRYGAHRAGLFGQGPALPAQGHLLRHLFVSREHAEVAEGNAREPVFLVLALRRGHRQAAARLRRAQVAVPRARFRRPAALLARDDERGAHRQVGRRRISITCWSTNTRTPTSCRATSCTRSSPTGRASPSSATTRRLSTRSAPRRSRTSSDSPIASGPRPRSITLAQNFRSSQSILDAANALMADAPRQYRKHLLSMRGQGPRPKLVTVDDLPTQAEFICTRVLAAREAGVPLKRQAVLFRTRCAQRRARDRARQARRFHS